MFYKLRFHTIFRKWDNIGYLIYQRVPLDIDRVVDEIGAIFLSYLDYLPASTKDISEKIVKLFTNVSAEEIESDMQVFLNDLVKEGFLHSGNTYEECLQEKDDFNYSISKMEAMKSLCYDKSGKRIDTHEYLEKIFAKTPKMLKCQIEITNKCNERCIHCYIPHKIKIHTIDDNIFYRTLDELDRLGIVSLGISGGEPMLHPHFKEFMIAVKKLNINITLLTNLTLLTDEYIELFKDSRITVLPSLYSLNESHHDYITKLPGSYKKTMDGIIKLRDNNIPVQINCPLMKANQDDYLELIRWAKKLNIIVKTDDCLIARSDRSTDNLENRIDLADIPRIIDDLLEENETFKQIISAEDYETQCERLFKDEQGKWCGVGITCCAIDAECNVCPCPSWADYNCGNLNNESLISIWQNSEVFRYLRSLSKKDFVKCNTCKDKAFCAVCMAKNANESPSKSPLDVSAYCCELAHINRLSVERWRAKNK